MQKLKTTYMGLELPNPVLVGSCGLTGELDKIKALEDNGAGGIVLKSLFEEQILRETDSLRGQSLYKTFADAEDYIRYYSRKQSLEDYLELIKSVKEAVDIPVIASINCISAEEWVTFGKKIEQAGADGLELNVFILPADPRLTSSEIERRYFEISKQISQYIKIPFALKISSYFSGMANFIERLSYTDVSGIVLFNRLYRPDIDLEKMDLTAAEIYSVPAENAVPLRWIGILSHQLGCDLAATTGIHDGEAVIKNLLAGAKAVQIVSVIYQQGPQVIRSILTQIEDWLEQKAHPSVAAITGKLNYKHISDPLIYERAQFMKYYSSKT